MKKLVLPVLLLAAFDGFSQSSVPPPRGLNPWYALDMDNDGSAPFDIAYFITMERAEMEADFGQSLSGYDIWVTAEDNVPYTPVSPIYNSLSAQQVVYLTFAYNGNGPVFQDVNLNGWLLPLEFFNGIQLNAIPFDGDFDNDGISNADEDLNGNLVLSDDHNGNMHFPNFMNPDDDGDGTPTIEEDYNGNGNLLDDDVNQNNIPDYLDPGVNLSAEVFEAESFVIYPNPASDKVNISVPGKTISVAVYDANGRLVLQHSQVAGPVEVSQLPAGSYFVKITDGQVHSVKKIIIK